MIDTLDDTLALIIHYNMLFFSMLQNHKLSL